MRYDIVLFLNLTPKVQNGIKSRKLQHHGTTVMKSPPPGSPFVFSRRMVLQSLLFYFASCVDIQGRNNKNHSYLTTLIFPTATAAENNLEYETLPSGVRIHDFYVGGSDNDSGSSITFNEGDILSLHFTGRLPEKNGWIFESTYDYDEPFKYVVGATNIVQGLELGLQGMRVGGRRRIIVPKELGYKDKQQEPVPRTLGRRRRLYSTVLESTRLDNPGMLVFDVQFVKIRKN